MSQPLPKKVEECDIFDDVEGRDTKHKIVKSMRYETMLNSFSRVATFAGGPLFGAGVVAAIGNFVGHAATVAGAAAGSAGAATGLTAAVATHATVGAAIVAALPAIGAAAATIMAVGALFVAAAVVADFVSTRIYQDKMLDMQEFNAKRAGHHIVHELQANSMCLTNGQSQPEYGHETRCDHAAREAQKRQAMAALQENAAGATR